MRFEYTGKTKKVGTHTVKQIKALDENSVFGVKPGDIGGWIEKNSNLKTNAPCWIGGDAVVMGDSIISDSVHITGAAIIVDSQISSGVCVRGEAHIVNSNLSIRGMIQDKAFLNNVCATGYNFFIREEGVISESKIQCNGFVCRENACVEGLTLETDKIMRTTFFERIEFRDHCILTGDIIMEGDNISIHDFVTLEGKIHIKNDSFDKDLSLRDFVSVKSQCKPNPYLIVDSLSGDTMIQV